MADHRVFFAKMAFWEPAHGSQSPTVLTQEATKIRNDALNFVVNSAGSLRAFVRPSGPKVPRRIKIEKIDPLAKHSDYVDRVLVVLFAKPSQPTKADNDWKIIGWIGNARVYRESRYDSPDRTINGKARAFNIEGTIADAFLIPPGERRIGIALPARPWLNYPEGSNAKKAFKFVTKYSGPNLLSTAHGFTSSDSEPSAGLSTAEILFPDELQEPDKFFEGAKKTVVVNAYERDAKARQRCIAVYGYKCHVCEFDFEKTYGKLGHAYIHVHHLMPLSATGKGYFVDPEKDLRPVCPNCHAMLHRQGNVISIEELRDIISACR